MDLKSTGSSEKEDLANKGFRMNMVNEVIKNTVFTGMSTQAVVKFLFYMEFFAQHGRAPSKEEADIANISV